MTMLEKLIKRLENFQSEIEKMNKDKSIAISILPDKDGYTDRECPNSDCLFQFKVHSEDWKNIFKDEKVFCPMCRHEAKSNSWWNSEQLKNGKEQAIQQIRKRVLSAWEGKRIQYNFVPIPAMEEMTLKIQCSECNARYSVVGSAFFCPCCGHNSVEKTFDESLNKVEIKINNIPTVRKAIETTSKDQAEITCRSLIENSLTDCIVAFQRFCEVTFQKENAKEKIPANVFQRLDDGNNLWKRVFNSGYQDWLTTFEFNRMNILFQRRHLLSHTEGIVDEKYLQRANDKTYKLGQRIVVKETDVIELVLLIRKVVAKIRELKTK